MTRARTLAQRSFMRKIGQKTTKTTKSNANMLAIAGETSSTSSASSSGPSTNNILPMLNPIEVEDESMAEGSEDELATPTVTTTPITTTTTTATSTTATTSSNQEPASKKRTLEKILPRKAIEPRHTTQVSSAEQKKRWEHLVAQGVKAFEESLLFVVDEKTRAATRELLAQAAAIQDGRLLCSYVANQELFQEIKAIQSQLATQGKSLTQLQAKAQAQPQHQPQPQPQPRPQAKGKPQKSYAEIANAPVAPKPSATTTVSRPSSRPPTATRPTTTSTTTPTTSSTTPVRTTVKQRREELQNQQLVVVTTNTARPSLDMLQQRDAINATLA